MDTLLELCRLAVSQVLQQYKSQIQDEQYQELLIPNLTPATNPKFGHYQLNNTMKIQKQLQMLDIKIIPKQLSESLCEAIKSLDTTSITSNVTVAAVFVNITLSDKFLISSAKNIFMTSETKLPVPPRVDPLIIAVDFSSPNVAKSMHVGHLRSTIIGDSICRLNEYLGHKVYRINHLGDWGTQFGMLIAHLKDNKLEDNECLPIEDLVMFYKEAKVKFDQDAEFQSRAKLEVVTLQGGNEVSLKLWKRLVELSLKEFQVAYDQLDVVIEPYGESFYNDKLAPIVEYFQKNGMAKSSNGAEIIEIEGAQHPFMIRKTDGGYTYDTTDLAAIRYRIETLHADKLLYVVDLGQSSHFQLLYDIAEQVGWAKKNQAQHIGFGVVLGEDGKRLKTRSGETVKLQELLNEAVIQARAQIKESGKDSQYTEAEMDEISKAIGIGSIKYADLSSQRTKDYKFSYEKMLSFKGNTCSYMLYSFTRISSIARKLNLKRSVFYSEEYMNSVEIKAPQEQSLLVVLLKCYTILVDTANDNMLHRICDWMYQIAGAYTTFYENCRVIGEDGTYDKSRLVLCEMTRQALRLCFKLIGIKEIEKM
ncbi:Arginyl-tRNA synthetase [Spironucleus salmonicida]|uniref:arginine--tRNA ligase n=1 Tax=Spironucleus salmonicida TaxID=348837 RepID=V6LC91_9EUKA|nr:Arginyl-tRNA synthetase [Spironucleus salmonicida]|eukprot:EST41853.1 Arginyl-tRNA synthetase [Spironucleus salmonicida]